MVASSPGKRASRSSVRRSTKQRWPFYTYLGPFTARVAGGSYELRTLALLTVGVAGFGAVLLAGRATDARGPGPVLKLVLAGHAAALLLLAALALGGQHSPVLLLAAIAVWSVFAWALMPPIQGSLLTVAPQAAMTALALNISALYLGSPLPERSAMWGARSSTAKFSKVLPARSASRNT